MRIALVRQQALLLLAAGARHAVGDFTDTCLQLRRETCTAAPGTVWNGSLCLPATGATATPPRSTRTLALAAQLPAYKYRYLNANITTALKHIAGRELLLIGDRLAPLP